MLVTRRDPAEHPTPASPPTPDGATVSQLTVDGELLTEFTVPIHIGSEVLGTAAIAYSVRTTMSSSSVSSRGCGAPFS